MKESKIIKTFPRFADDTPISSPGCEYQFGIFPSGKGCFASYTKCANGVPSEVSQMIPFSQLELLLWFRCTANWGSPTTTGFTLATGLTCSWSTLVRHSSGWNCFRTRILTTLLNIIFAGCDPGAALGDFRWTLIFEIFSKINIHHSMLVQALATCKTLHWLYAQCFSNRSPHHHHPCSVPKWKLVHEQARGSCEFSLKTNSGSTKAIFFLVLKRGWGRSQNTLWLWSNPTLIQQRAGVLQMTSSPRWQKDSSPSRGQNS